MGHRIVHALQRRAIRIVQPPNDARNAAHSCSPAPIDTKAARPASAESRTRPGVGPRSVAGRRREAGAERFGVPARSATTGAGTGDVLTGIVAAFLAKGVEPRLAAAAAAVAHGLAARTLPARGVVAGDLPPAVAQLLSTRIPLPGGRSSP